MVSISIIIPAYNEEKYIGKTLESIKNQSFKDYEIIVVCNGCTDNTSQIAKKYSNKIFFLKEKNVNKARNYGAEKAQGDILIFLDADVVIPNILKKIVQIYSNNNVIGTVMFAPDIQTIRYKIYSFVKNNVLKPFNMASNIIFCEKDIFMKINGFIKYPGEYHDIIKRAKRHVKFIVLKQKIIVSMRRYEKISFIESLLFWIKTKLFNINKYKTIR